MQSMMISQDHLKQNTIIKILSDYKIEVVKPSKNHKRCHIDQRVDQELMKIYIAHIAKRLWGKIVEPMIDNSQMLEGKEIWVMLDY